MTPVIECCVCYSTTIDIEPELKNSFITIPCGGQHVMCFSCFMRNASAKCPMCRFNYKTMKPADAEPDSLPVMYEQTIIHYPIEQNETLAFIDGCWMNLRHLISEMMPPIQSEVFEKGRNITNVDGGMTINFEWVRNAIDRNKRLADKLIDINDDYEMCCRMYLTKMLVAYHEIDEEEDDTNFVSAVNDFIQHEYDFIQH